MSDHGLTEPREIWGVMQLLIVTVQSIMKHHYYYYYHDALEKSMCSFPGRVSVGFEMGDFLNA